MPDTNDNADFDFATIQPEPGYVPSPSPDYDSSDVNYDK